MANNWRLLKTNEDVKEAMDYTFDNNEPIEILTWDEQTKQASVSEIGIRTKFYGTMIQHALAWRPSEDEEKFKKFLAKLDGDYDAYVLEFSAQATVFKRFVIAKNICESLERELPYLQQPRPEKADYFVFENVGNKVIILVDDTMSFDIPMGIDVNGGLTGYVTRIQKTTPSYAAHDNNCFGEALKEQREKFEKRFFGDEEDD